MIAKNVYGDKVVYAECNRRNRLSEFQQYCLSSYTELFDGIFLPEWIAADNSKISFCNIAL